MPRDFQKTAAAMVAGTEKAIAAAVEPLLKRIEALEARPLPERGEKGERGDQGPAGPGIKGAIRDHDGVLFFTLTDGTLIECGNVTGPRGEKGEKGDAGEKGEAGDRGEKGDPGETFTLDDFDIEAVDERTIKMVFAKGDARHSFELALPAIVYRKAFKEGETYARGDVVSFGGSAWHSEKDCNTEKPGTGDAWSLMVKRGRDGKDKA